MKTEKELKIRKNEVEAPNTKLAELNEAEQKQVAGGLIPIPFASSAAEKGKPDGKIHPETERSAAAPKRIDNAPVL